MTLEEWMEYVDRALLRLSSGNRGLGKTLWFPAIYDANQYRQIGPFAPSWRKLQDSRIELRGRLMKYTMLNNVVTNVPLSSGDVIMRLPFECSPPGNAQVVSSVTALAPCSIANGNPGVFRIDVQREVAWKEYPAEDADGNPIYSADGELVMENDSLVEIIARPPAERPITDWIGFDGVFYDPHLYLDALAPVPIGQDPLIANHGYAIMQHGDGRVEWYTPGVSYSPA
jgi:hypothetical protein